MTEILNGIENKTAANKLSNPKKNNSKVQYLRSIGYAS